MVVQEPQDDIMFALRANLTDYNSSNRIGTHWIFPDLPRVKDLKLNSYPRIGIQSSEIGEVAGTYGDDLVNHVTFFITIASKKGLIGTNAQEGQQLVDTIGRDIISYLRQNWKSSDTLRSKFMSFAVDGYRQLPYDEEFRVFRREMEITAIYFNAGE